MRRHWTLLLLVGSLALTASACANESSEDDEEEGSSEGAQTAGGEGIVYFHGMSKLGFSRTALRNGLGGKEFLAPSLSDGQLQATKPQANVTSFLDAKDSAIAAGYSLGRAPVVTLMKTEAKHLKRAILIDPTYDSYTFGRGVGGDVAKQWLDGDDDRSFMLVYGDVTVSLGGEKSFKRALADHPRAQLCYVPGDHARFRADDMTAAIVATDCDDLKERLTR